MGGHYVIAGKAVPNHVVSASPAIAWASLKFSFCWHFSSRCKDRHGFLGRLRCRRSFLHHEAQSSSTRHSPNQGWIRWWRSFHSWIPEGRRIWREEIDTTVTLALNVSNKDVPCELQQQLARSIRISILSVLTWRGFLAKPRNDLEHSICRAHGRESIGCYRQRELGSFTPRRKKERTVTSRKIVWEKSRLFPRRIG